MRIAAIAVAIAAPLALGGCEGDAPPERSTPGLACDADDGGLELPPGFCALVVADYLGSARHLAVTPGGDVYVALRNRRLDFGGIVALRDTDGDGRAEVVEHFGDEGGVGIELRGPWLYLGADRRIVRYRIAAPGLVPAEPPEAIVVGLPEAGYHSSRTFAFRGEDLLLNVGAPSNACQLEDRARGSPGRDPCPELEIAGGIWRYAADRQGQRHPQDGTRYASGIRHALAIAREPVTGTLYVLQHGRDALHGNWPELFSAAEDERLPAEELIAVAEGGRYGWPYCYYDAQAGRMVLAPEYGGDGEREGRCAAFPEPLVALPAHAGPNDMVFYDAGRFPPRYRGGLFVALHGRYRAADGRWAGYEVAFIPFADGVVAGPWERFAGGFSPEDARGAVPPEEARYRPTGLAGGPDGSLYVSDSQVGRVWRILYTGADGGGGRQSAAR